MHKIDLKYELIVHEHALIQSLHDDSISVSEIKQFIYKKMT